MLDIVGQRWLRRRLESMSSGLLRGVRDAFGVAEMLALLGGRMGSGRALRLLGGMRAAAFRVAGRRFLTSMPLCGAVGGPGAGNKKHARNSRQQSDFTKHGKLPRI
jgi:hypothetical protein